MDFFLNSSLFETKISFFYGKPGLFVFFLLIYNIHILFVLVLLDVLLMQLISLFVIEYVVLVVCICDNFAYVSILFLKIFYGLIEYFQ